MFKLGLCLYLVTCFSHNSWAQSTTAAIDNTTLVNVVTTDNVTNNATSTVPSTTPTTTTPTTTTTTTISPTIPGTEIPANTDIGKCPCDMTGNACDVNCCCDPDCSDSDKEVFPNSECIPNSYVLDDKLCFDQEVFLFENGPARSGETNGLFCIYFDNDEARNYYINPSLVRTEEEFLKYTARYRKFSFQASAPVTDTAVFPPYYKSGDPIYVVFSNQAFSTLGLPASLAASPVCTDSNPAAYLIDQSHNCARIFSSLGTNCVSDVALQASTFYEGFRIVKSPFLLQAFNSSTTVEDPTGGCVDLTSVTDLFNNNYTVPVSLDPNTPLQCIKAGVIGPCAFTTPPQTPTFNSGSNTCENLLVQVHYRFTTNGVCGIDKAYVSFVFSDIQDSSVTQTFSTSFASSTSSSDERIERSGNPGYVVGQPILAGVLNITTDGVTTEEKILLTQDRGQQFTLVRPSVDGDCLNAAGQEREPVLFGEDMRTGCFIQITPVTASDVCQLLQESIINAVEGFPVPSFASRNNRYVAMFGNSDTGRTGDWVGVLFKNRPDPPVTTGSLCSLSLGANIQILYANVGSIPNPQAKIIGVAYVYDAPQPVQYRCSGPFCQPGSATVKQKIEISSSVTFIDVSKLPEGVEGVYPTFAVRLPYDFFYPFLSSASTGLSISYWILVLCLFGILELSIYGRSWT